MASSKILIHQDGLPATQPGFARTDGVNNKDVILTSADPGTTNRFRILWAPVGDTTSVLSLQKVNPNDDKVWKFSPTPGTYGSWRIELLVDEGTANEKRSTRIFGVRTPNRGILIPALNERAHTEGSLVFNGPELVELSENNEPTPAFPDGSFAGWWRSLHELAVAADLAAGPAPTPPQPHVFTATNGQAAFNLPYAPASSLHAHVYVTGVKLASTQYAVAGNTVTIEDATMLPGAGDLVEILVF